MSLVSLGQQGLQVPAIGLGCMGMSEFYGPADEVESLHVLDHALSLGCNFWDTADMYGPFRNERLLGKALEGRRSQVIVATKFGVQRSEQGEWLGVNGRPEYVKACCDASLQRLKTDYIDLYYQHRVDPEVPIDETVGAMAELVQAGKVRYLGLSEANPTQLEQAHRVHPISALQTEYSLWSREVEEEILPTCQRLGIGFVAYSPLGRGYLSGAIRESGDLAADDWRLNNPRFQAEALQHNAALLSQIEQLAQEYQCSSAQIALAWLLTRVPRLALIPGTKRRAYLEQNWQAQELCLSATDLDQLDRFSAQFHVHGTRY